ncbi:hypothetical protein L596_022956 [Steinernema carpocapsae]|uniref:Uncharacterized protein n=1 Tax=Steinernema carpocapsae TaxID=34508 RepID=A0A4U5MC48_STECR|nr:hypothetical protein L596_022956 [Steinernema carpocapsae]
MKTKIFVLVASIVLASARPERSLSDGDAHSGEDDKRSDPAPPPIPPREDAGPSEPVDDDKASEDSEDLQLLPESAKILLLENLAHHNHLWTVLVTQLVEAKTLACLQWTLTVLITDLEGIRWVVLRLVLLRLMRPVLVRLQSIKCLHKCMQISLSSRELTLKKSKIEKCGRPKCPKINK